MKTNKLLNFALAGLVISSMFWGCTDDFEELNTNERVLSELDAATIGNLYARVQYYGHQIQSNQISQNLFADHYCQYFANTQNAFSSDRYVLVGGWLRAAWRNIYGNIPNNLGEVLAATDPTENPGFESMWAVAVIMKVIIYERVANYWGPIPYSQVNNGEAAVPYDSQQDVYHSFFTELDAALAILNPLKGTGANAYGANDQVYNGDIDKWIVFANTLRLRIALRLAEVEPQTAQTQAEKAVQDGVMESTADDGFFTPTANNRNNMNRMIPWNEFRMSSTMESVLLGYDDPRIAGFFLPCVDQSLGEYRGLRNGYTVVDLAAEDLFYDKLSKMGPRWETVAQEAENPWEFIMSPEAWFCRAEGALRGWNMGATAEECYNNGIEASMNYWGITDAGVINSYQQSMNVPIATHDAPTPVSTIPVRFDAGNADIAKEQIATQKWLGLYPNGWEAWADQRRQDLPKRYPIMASENPDVGVNDMMRRVTFISDEYEQNAAAVADAITKLGGPDNGATRLWWDPE